MSGLQRKCLIGTAGFMAVVVGLFVLVSLLYEAAELERGSYVWLLVLVGCGAVTAALVLVWVAVAGLRRRLLAVTTGLERAARGDLHTELDTQGHDEISQLAKTFAWMRDRLKESTVSRDHLDRLLSGMNEALLVTKPDGEIHRVNSAAAELLGYDPEELVGQPIASILGFDPADSTSPGPTRATPRESSFRRRDGSSVPVSYTVSEIRGDENELEGRVYAAQDIGERKKVEQRIRYLARVDPLTKMSNRLQFQHQLQQSIARARRAGKYMAILYMDIDRYKDINDTFGHAAGDTSLEIFARRITAELPSGSVAGRLAGDEFAILISGFEGAGELMEEVPGVAERLLRTIGRPFHVQGEEVFISASMGIAVYPSDGDSVIDLLRNADAALYQAKKSGGNCFEFYSSEMNTAAVERLMLKSKLRRAMERDELIVHYQPKYSLSSGRVEGVEALLRWDLPDRGVVFPSDFIPLAEETNLILQLGDWVLERVCKDYRRWQRSLPSPVRVSVNLSLRQLQQRGFLQRVQEILQSHGISPTCLELEITETTLMEDTAHTIRILDSLYGMGLHLAIDDFGTGYSSLSALQQFPIDTLKIDQSFVRDVAFDSDDAAIVATIIKMGRSLKMEVVAEGVESQQQLDFLRGHDCDYAQGRLFGEPMAADDFLELLLAQADGSGRHQALFA
jgi:diguanylate cyclase (GGDEF)-like protein/PAS domain S-box-containing protein